MGLFVGQPGPACFPLGGSALDRNLVNMDRILKDNRRHSLFQHFVEGASRFDVPITVVYTTEGERAQAEDINNASKNEILQRTESQISLLSDAGSDGHTKAVLVEKLTELKRKQSSLKKEVLLSLYLEVCEELKLIEDADQIMFIEDLSEDDDCAAH